jgi:hypothetical protein
MMTPITDEQAVIGRINALRAAGVSLTMIARILTDAGIVTKKGKARWYAETVKSILQRQAALAA